MDTKKLSKIIKAIVSAEVKRQLPVLVKEEVNKKMKKVLTEVKKMNQSKVQPTATKTVAEEDMFDLASQVLVESREEDGGSGWDKKPQLSMIDDEEEAHLSKNPMIDKILKETKPFTAAQRTAGPVGFEQKFQQINEASGNPSDYDEWPSMEHNMSANPGEGSPVPDDVKADMVAKMGYGDMANGPQKGGLGVKTGLPHLDRILNRDNSELVKKFKTR